MVKLKIKRLLYEISSNRALPIKGDFPTVTIRGAFGYSLLQVVARDEAIGDDRKVEICRHLFFPNGISDKSSHENCARPFVIRGSYTRPDRKAFIMEMLLFGDAVEFEQLVDDVIENMCKMGLGNNNIVCGFCKIYSEIVEPVVPELTSGVCEVEFISPARIKSQGRYLLDMIPFHNLIWRLADRFNELSVVYGDTEEHIDFSVLKHLSGQVLSEPVSGGVFRSERKSTRTGDICSLSGFTGTMLYQGDLGPFEDLLSYLPWIGVGNSTAFGCGWCNLN